MNISLVLYILTLYFIKVIVYPFFVKKNYKTIEYVNRLSLIIYCPPGIQYRVGDQRGGRNFRDAVPFKIGCALRNLLRFL